MASQNPRTVHPVFDTFPSPQEAPQAPLPEEISAQVAATLLVNPSLSFLLVFSGSRSALARDSVVGPACWSWRGELPAPASTVSPRPSPNLAAFHTSCATQLNASDANGPVLRVKKLRLLV